MISKQEYQAQVAQGYSRISLIQEPLADLDTPLSLYLKLVNRPYTYLLESVVGGERFDRYSFIGLSCGHYLKVCGKHVDVHRNGEIVEQHDGNPLPFIETLHNRFKTPEVPSLSRFTGGLVGYFGYETIYNFEHFAHRLKNTVKTDPFGTSDIPLVLSQELVVIDNLSGKIHLIVCTDPSQPDGYECARERFEDICTQLCQNCAILSSFGNKYIEAINELGQEPPKAYVDKIEDYIFAGNCMQVVPSQRMNMKLTDSPLALYRILRTLNPSPYLFYHDFGDFHIAGPSPEIPVRREHDDVTAHPIAGTRLRGKTPAEDLASEQDLLSDAKEIAEHVMLIDLGRNDAGRISKTGEVKVTDKMVIKKYPYVMHIVPNVEGRLKEGVTNVDILAVTFPAGTLSGAPKVRAMEIIREVEPNKRGIYGGAVGVWGFNNDMDLAIAICTAVVKNNTLYVQSGVGIVADSDSTSEQQETQNKTQAVVRAAQMVQEGSDKQVSDDLFSITNAYYLEIFIMQITQLKFVTNVRNAKKSTMLTKEVKQALDIIDNTDEYTLIIEVSLSNGPKIVVINTASGGEIKASDFSDHTDNGELVAVTVSKLLIRFYL